VNAQSSVAVTLPVTAPNLRDPFVAAFSASPAQRMALADATGNHVQTPDKDVVPATEEVEAIASASHQGSDQGRPAWQSRVLETHAAPGQAAVTSDESPRDTIVNDTPLWRQATDAFFANEEGREEQSDPGLPLLPVPSEDAGPALNSAAAAVGLVLFLGGSSGQFLTDEEVRKRRYLNCRWPIFV
jgi:hypothetical protein